MIQYRTIDVQSCNLTKLRPFTLSNEYLQCGLNVIISRLFHMLFRKLTGVHKDITLQRIFCGLIPLNGQQSQNVSLKFGKLHFVMSTDSELDETDFVFLTFT